MNETYDTGEGTGAGLFYWGCEGLRVLLQLIGLGRRAGHICELGHTAGERDVDDLVWRYSRGCRDVCCAIKLSREIAPS